MNLKLLREDLEEAGYKPKLLGKIFNFDPSLFRHIYSGRIKLSVERFEKLCKLTSYPPCRYFSEDTVKVNLCTKLHTMDNEKLSAILTLLN